MFRVLFWLPPASGEGVGVRCFTVEAAHAAAFVRHCRAGRPPDAFEPRVPPPVEAEDVRRTITCSLTHRTPRVATEIGPVGGASKWTDLSEEEATGEGFWASIVAVHQTARGL
jgi:hypothetical protein